MDLDLHYYWSLDELRWHLAGYERCIATGKTARGWLLSPEAVKQLQAEVTRLRIELERREAAAETTATA